MVFQEGFRADQTNSVLRRERPLNPSEKFRATLAARLMPFFHGEGWFNSNGLNAAAYFAKQAVEMADAIIAETKKEKTK